ncbi:MAG: hypothetical protein M2R46_02216 [Verrucomicrobia subdivision 3 bacterium]|nr:hypothetical protein [Limisphaerales bacterium]
MKVMKQSMTIGLLLVVCQFSMASQVRADDDEKRHVIRVETKSGDHPEVRLTKPTKIATQEARWVGGGDRWIDGWIDGFRSPKASTRGGTPSDRWIDGWIDGFRSPKASTRGGTPSDRWFDGWIDGFLDSPKITFQEVRWVGDRKERTWLGVHIGRVSETTAAQVELKPGRGLIVQHVVQDSPAAEAGLKRFDILTALDDQILVNPDQLQVLVAGYEKDDVISLSVIRGGESLAVKATLTKRKPTSMRVRKTDEYERPRLRSWIERLDTDGDVVSTEILNELIWDGKVLDDVDVFHSRIVEIGSAGIVFKDDSGTYRVTNKDGLRFLRFEDKDGKVVFDGEFNEDSKDVPVHVLEKLKSIRAPEEFGVRRLRNVFERLKNSDGENISVDVRLKETPEGVVDYRLGSDQSY